MKRDLCHEPDVTKSEGVSKVSEEFLLNILAHFPNEWSIVRSLSSRADVFIAWM